MAPRSPLCQASGAGRRCPPPKARAAARARGSAARSTVEPSASTASIRLWKPRPSTRSIIAWCAPPVGSREHLDVVRAHDCSPSRVVAPRKLITNGVGRVVVELLRRTDLLDLAGVDEHDLVGELHRLFLVVRHEHRRRVDLLVQLAQPRAQLCRTFTSSAPNGSSSSSSRGSTASARASAIRCRWPPDSSDGIAARQAGQVHEVEQLVDAALVVTLSALASAGRRRRCPTPSCAGTRRSAGRRSRCRDGARARRSCPARRCRRDRVRLLQTGDDAQQRRLPAAAGTEQGSELPRSMLTETSRSA